jgi:hypothetical protein
MPKGVKEFRIKEATMEMDCIICWDSVLTPDVDTFCGRESHGICGPCFYHMRQLNKVTCPVCRGQTGGTRSDYTVRMDAVLAVPHLKQENREEYIIRVRTGICSAATQLLIGMYLCATFFIAGMSTNIVYSMCTLA